MTVPPKTWVAPHTNFAAVPAFNVGDRVRLKSGPHVRWEDSKLASRAKNCRMATVTAVYGTAVAPWDRSYSIEFDIGPREKRHVALISPRVLEAAT